MFVRPWLPAQIGENTCLPGRFVSSAAMGDEELARRCVGQASEQMSGDDRRPMVLVILDGLGDRGSDELDGLTPCEAASTPVLDRLAAQGQNGVLLPFGPGRATSSERSHWSLFGFGAVSFPGRAALEALGVGLEPPSQTPLFQIALREGDVREGALYPRRARETRAR